MAKQQNKPTDSGASVGFESRLWDAADKLRGVMDAAEYKHVVLGLIFLKYVSDAFEERRAWLAEQSASPDSEWFVKDTKQREAVLEDRDEYRSENVFWVPTEGRWTNLRSRAKDAKIGLLLDSAMDAASATFPSSARSETRPPTGSA